MGCVYMNHVMVIMQFLLSLVMFGGGSDAYMEDLLDQSKSKPSNQESKDLNQEYKSLNQASKAKNGLFKAPQAVVHTSWLGVFDPEKGQLC